ncbi:MAG: tRNA pseudouridine(38-40) synthase TruA [Elainellaceae cyanobacterium]
MAVSPSDYSGANGAASVGQRRIAMVIQYVGTHYHGWQRQPHHISIQEVIETVLHEFLGGAVVVHAAGRTDSGVHAAAQVAHFDAPGHIPAHRWASILNGRLPKDIVIRASAEVGSSWHARFSALWRRYRYTIYTDRHPNLFVRPFSWHYYHEPIDAGKIRAALQPLLGRHHLAAFHRAGSDRPHSWVDVQDTVCERSGPFVRVELQASGFLYGMVRLLVGMLVDVGCGKRSLASFQDVWQLEQRDQVKYAAPPQGLCLLRVGYPDIPFSREIWYDTQPLFCLPTPVPT